MKNPTEQNNKKHELQTNKNCFRWFTQPYIIGIIIKYAIIYDIFKYRKHLSFSDKLYNILLHYHQVI